jgi:hypothetical protein
MAIELWSPSRGGAGPWSSSCGCRAVAVELWGVEPWRRGAVVVELWPPSRGRRVVEEWSRGCQAVAVKPRSKPWPSSRGHQAVTVVQPWSPSLGRQAVSVVVWPLGRGHIAEPSSHSS